MEIKDIKESIDVLHKSVDTKLEASTKTLADNFDAKFQEAEKEISEKSARVVNDQLDRFREQQEALQAKAATSFGAGQVKSFDEQLKDALLEHTDDIAKLATKDRGAKDFSIDLSTKAVGDNTMANYTGGTRGLTVLRDGIILRPERKVRMRDLLPGGNIGPGTEYVFMKEDGAGEGAITPVAEGATKPQIDLDLVESSVKIETIAGWMRVTRKAMSNIPGFVSFIQAKLPQKLMDVEDAQILSGNGISPNLKGILTAGNFTAASGAATLDVEQLVQAIAQLEGLNREANGIVLSVADYYNILLNKATGSGEYDLPGVTTVDANGTLRLMGIPVVRTTAMATDKFLVGDFTNGAQFLTQEGMRIEFFEQDGDNVRTNKVTIRIEETVALPVYGSDFFIYGDFGNVA